MAWKNLDAELSGEFGELSGLAATSTRGWLAQIEDYRNWQLDRRHDRRVAGTCRRPGCSDPKEHTQGAHFCIAHRVIADEERRLKHQAYLRGWRRRKRKERAEAGLCHCGRERRGSRYKTCERCYQKGAHGSLVQCARCDEYGHTEAHCNVPAGYEVDMIAHDSRYTMEPTVRTFSEDVWAARIDIDGGIRSVVVYFHLRSEWFVLPAHYGQRALSHADLPYEVQGKVASVLAYHSRRLAS